MQKTFSHEITVDLAVSQAFPLFTPKGEESWVPGWKPNYIQPATGETCEEMIFTTGESEEKTFWTCLSWEPDKWHVRYLRITPASRVAFVDVRCTPVADDRTQVRVVYEMRALTDVGHSHIEDLSEDAFVKSIDEWADLISSLTVNR